MQNIGKGLVAGFAATVVLSALMIAKGAMGLMPELEIARMLGTMLGDGPGVGWLAHFMIGTLLWGVLFAWLDPTLPGSSHMMKGVIFGLGAWLLMMIIVMPMAGAGFFGLNLGLMAPIMTLLLHAIFGAVLGGVYGWQRPTRRIVMNETKVASDLPGRARAERQVEGNF